MSVTLTNPLLSEEQEVLLDIPYLSQKAEIVEAKILTADDIHAHNTFEKPDSVILKPFSEYEINSGKIKIKLPPKSVVGLSVKGYED